jgi:hypothetical protein
MHLQVYGGEEKGENTCARSLASPRRAGPGVAWHDDGRGRTTSFCCLFLL